MQTGSWGSRWFRMTSFFLLHLVRLQRGPRGEMVMLRPPSPMSLQTTAWEEKYCLLTNHGHALTQRKVPFHTIFITSQDENLGENVISTFLAGQRDGRKNEPVFHSSLPTLGHLCVNFLLSQKLSKPFAWSVNKQKAKSNPFSPNLRPGKSLTKQNSPVTYNSWVVLVVLPFTPYFFFFSSSLMSVWL